MINSVTQKCPCQARPEIALSSPGIGLSSLVGFRVDQNSGPACNVSRDSMRVWLLLSIVLVFAAVISAAGKYFLELHM